MKKIAEYYLAAVSIAYIILGVCVIFPFRILRGLAIYLGFGGMMIGAIPNFVASSGITRGSIIPSVVMPFTPMITFFACIAIILGILGIISLFKIAKNPQWIWVWYVISVLAIVIGLSNIFLSNIFGFEEMIFSGLYPIIMIFATYQFRKKSL